MPIDSLQTLLAREIRELLGLEVEVQGRLHRMGAVVRDLRLRELFEEHLRGAAVQVRRLDRVCQLMGIPSRPLLGKGAEGLLLEIDAILDIPIDPFVLDAVLCARAQKVGSLEISAYGVAIAHARELGQDQIVDILSLSEDEEIEVHRRLGEIAEGGVIARAMLVGG